MYEFEREGLDALATLERRQRLLAWQHWEQTRSHLSSSQDPTLARLRRDTFDAFLADCRGQGDKDTILTVQFVHTLWPEWPKEPYLSVPPFERQRRRRACWAENPPRRLKLVDLRDIYRDIVTWKRSQAGEEPNPQYRLPYWRGYKLGMDPDTWSVRRERPKKGDSFYEIAAFEIDFSYSNAVLVGLFKNWLVARRKLKDYPTRGAKDLRVEQEEMRGDLTALGAARLLDSGMTAQEARDYTQLLAGEPLYGGEGEWSKAYKRGREVWRPK